MQSVLKKLRNLFCYCGVTREEYKSIKKDAYISNFTVWKYIHVLLLAAYAAMAIYSASGEGVSIPFYIQTAMVCYFAVIGILFFFCLKEDSLIAQFAIYFSMILLLLSSLIINVFQPETISVTFMVLLVMLPMVMIDKPYFMSILLVAAVAVYLFIMKQTCPPESFRYNVIMAIIYGTFGIIINTFYNYIRVGEFVLQKREHEYIEEQKTANAETEKLNTALKAMSESVIELLGDIVESRDLESGEHVKRVKGFAYILGTQIMKDLPEYKLDEYTVDLIAFTAALHDVGKISIPDSILTKPGTLTEQEFEEMKTHCEKAVK